MKPLTKRLLNLALIFGTLAIVLYIGFQDHNLPDTVKVLTSISVPAVILCVLLYLLFVFCDALSIWYFLRRQGYRVGILYVYFTSIAGQYYSNITPGATGGQPMQIYYLHKRNIPTGVATSALITRFFSFQFMLLVIGTFCWVTHIEYVRQHFGDWYWALIMGYVWNVMVCALIIVMSFFRPAVRWIANLALKLGAKLRLIKNPEKTREKWMRSVDNFHNTMRDVLHHPADLCVQLLIGAAQLLALMTIVWFIYKQPTIGVPGAATYPQIITLDVLEYTAAAYTPLPGASGAQEVMFAQAFGGVFGGNTFPAQLLWRFFTFYISLIIGLVVVTADGLRSGKSLREVANMRDRIEAENKEIEEMHAEQKPENETAENE